MHGGQNEVTEYIPVSSGTIEATENNPELSGTTETIQNNPESIVIDYIEVPLEPIDVLENMEVETTEEDGVEDEELLNLIADAARREI